MQLFVLWMLVVGTVCVVLWRRVAAITRTQIIMASVAFVAGILIAAPPPVGVLDYVGLTIAAVALTFLLEVVKRRRGTPRIL